MFKPGGSFGIMSGDAPRYGGELHHLGHEGLKAQLRLLNLKFDETSGNYDGPERALVVYGPSREQMFDLGKKFGQQSIIWGHTQGKKPYSELLYTNGPDAGKAHMPAEPHVQHFDHEPENYYTKVPGGKTFFQLRYDQSKVRPVPINVGTRHPSALAPAQNPRPDLQKNLQDAQARRPKTLHPHSYPWHDGHTDHIQLWQRPGGIMVVPGVEKNDGARTDQSMMFDHARDLKGSFAKGAITDPSMGLQPFKGSVAAGIVAKGDNIGGPNSAGDMSVPPPKGSFQSTNRDHEDGQLGLGKDEPNPATKPFNEQAAGVGGAPEYKHFAAPFGTVTPGEPSELRHYRYEGRLPDVAKQVRDHGFTTYMAGGKYGKPDLAHKNYNTKHLMIYDPDPGTGGDFNDAHYTNAWRQQHELAHALTYPEINKLYGEGRRIGKLGVHRSLNEAQRAVHWEWLAGHRQRALASQMGLHIPDEDFNREMNTIMHDAAHRAVTGKFTEPGAEGFHPHSHLVPLETAMGLVNEHAQRLGLQDPHSTLHKAEPFPITCPKCKHPAFTWVKGGEPICRNCAINRPGPNRAIAGGGETTPPKSGHLRVVKTEGIHTIFSKGEVVPIHGTPTQDPQVPFRQLQGQVAPVARLPTSNTIGKCDFCGALGHLTHRLAADPDQRVCTTCSKYPKLTGQVTPNITKSEGENFLTLEKRSKNVREQIRNAPPESLARRTMMLLDRLGFRANASQQDRFGIGKDQRGVTWNRNVFGENPTDGGIHEVAHALMTPVGSTLRGYQQDLGQVSAKVRPKYPGELGHAEEAAAFEMEPLLHRRAGLPVDRSSGFNLSPKAVSNGRARATEVLSAYDTGHQAIDPKGKVVATKPNLDQRLTNLQRSEEPQSTVSATEQRSMANDDSADQKFYTPQQTRMLLAKALRERINDYAETLENLQKREASNLAKALSGGMGAGSPQGRVGADALGKVAPPGREDQVQALKPKVGVQSAFKIAWAQANKNKTQKNMTGGSENVSSGTPGLMMSEPVAKTVQPSGQDAVPSAPSSMNLHEGQGPRKPDAKMLAQKPAVAANQNLAGTPGAPKQPRSNSFMTAGNNQPPKDKGEGRDASGKVDGRVNTMKPDAGTQPGLLPGDQKPTAVKAEPPSRHRVWEHSSLAPAARWHVPEQQGRRSGVPQGWPGRRWTPEAHGPGSQAPDGRRSRQARGRTETRCSRRPR